MIAAAFVANAIVFGFAAPANAQTKVALVFGNGAYPFATGPSQQHVQPCPLL
jgi:hypothetical protein